MTRSRRELERSLRDRLAAVRAPDEPGAAARARRRVRAAHAASTRVTTRAWRPLLAVAVATAAAVVLGLGLTAPGKAVGDWLRDVVEPRPAQRPARPAPALPAPGRVLVATGDRIALVAGGRAPARLGRYRDATWSPGGRFAAVTTRRALLAVTPHGATRWRVVPAQPPRHPRWSPDGFRIAYLSGAELRVVVANGSDDRLFRGHVANVAPAFRPGAGRTVAWVDADRHVRVADVDLAVLRWRSPVPVPAGARALSWSADGRRLLVAGRRRVLVFELPTGRVRSIRTRAPVIAAAFPPRGDGPAAVVERRAGRSRLVLLGRRESLIETSGTYEGLVWSPDGRWVLTGWAEQWILVRADGRRITTAPDRGRPLAWAR